MSVEPGFRRIGSQTESGVEGTRLEGDQVHLWWTVPPVRIDPLVVRDGEGLLGPEEVGQHRRFLSDLHRRMFLISRVLLRTTLSRYTEVPPAAWVFRRSRQGRPELEPGQCDIDLRFNLSHTGGLIALAVTIGRDIGADVEDLSRQGRDMAIAGRFYSRLEMESLQALPAERRHERFLQFWTLKEAYIKARGLGVPATLSRVSFLLTEDRSIEARFDPGLGDDPGAWQFELFRPTNNHLMALAVRRGSGLDLHIRIQRTESFLE
jgi:4'-phosphopantetheinyl transferase